METYRERVKRAAEAKTGEPIYNGSVDHAAVLAEAMFAYAHDEVCILTGELNARVYGRASVVEQATLFLADPEHHVSILIENLNAIDFENHPLLKSISDKSNIKVRIVPEYLQEKYSFHFIVVDKDSYRFERNKEEPIAIAAFGEEQGGENLHRIFKSLWTLSSDIASKH